MTYEEAEEWLFKLPRFGTSGTEAYKPGLHRIDALLRAMDRPQDAYPAILVAGTNGKGTVASMIAAISTAAGKRTGLHTSPHLLSLGERMRINGAPADRTWLQGAISDHADAIRDVGASFFEASVALSLLFFAQHEVDVGIVEVGLGGRLDATNILEPVLSVITNVAYDHTDILGTVLSDIAVEKAGIMRPEKPVLAGTTDRSVNTVLGNIADRMGAEFHLLSAEIEMVTDSSGKVFVETLRDRYGPIVLPLEGQHHLWHAALAIRASELCSRLLAHSGMSVLTGLASLTELSGLRGRMELIHSHPDIWVDVAHNPQAIAAAIDTRQQSTRGVGEIFIGLQKDKDADSIAAVLARSQLPVTILSMGHARAARADDLNTIFRQHSVEVLNHGLGTRASLSAWLEHARPESSVLVMGSHVIVAEALEWALHLD